MQTKEDIEKDIEEQYESAKKNKMELPEHVFMDELA